MNIVRFGCHTAKLSFVFLLSCLLALSSGLNAKADIHEMAVAPSGIHLSGRFLHDASGIQDVYPCTELTTDTPNKHVLHVVATESSNLLTEIARI